MDEPTTFEIDLVLGGVRHVYSVSLDDERVLAERAVRYPKGKESLLFERNRDAVEFGPALRARGRVIAELLRPNAAFLSTAAATNDPTLLPALQMVLAKPAPRRSAQPSPSSRSLGRHAQWFALG